MPDPVQAGARTPLPRGWSSPATTATAVALTGVAAAYTIADPKPATVEELRRLSREAAGSVDTWLAHHACRVFMTDDIDCPTLAERPELQLAALLAAAARPVEQPIEPDPSPMRDRVLPSDRDAFDAVLAEARYGLRQRGDVVGIRWNWSVGLLRTTTGPDGQVAQARAERRNLISALPPPDALGDPEPPPPLGLLPRPMARAAAALLTMLEADAVNVSTEALNGTGIGPHAYVGRACVAHDVDDALTRLEPGDVLVTAFTGPAYNAILPILGALVVEAGGPICHAAIAAREFGPPAVIGAAGATTHIRDGAQVEVDPSTASSAP